MTRVLLMCAAMSIACSEESAPERAPPSEPREGLHLGVPADVIRRARNEAGGLARMTESLRAGSLERGRAHPSPSFAELARDPDAHANERVSYEGRIGLLATAGPRLYIMALQTRREGDRWTDPIYVLSVIHPQLAVGAIARIDGWVVGRRTIGHNALPLIVAFHVEPALPSESTPN